MLDRERLHTNESDNTHYQPSPIELNNILISNDPSREQIMLPPVNMRSITMDDELIRDGKLTMMQAKHPDM